jgi:hypothetical protein
MRDRSIARGMAAIWLGLSVCGALNHRLIPGIYPRDGILSAVLPHLKYGYVMFDRMPDRFVVVSYRDGLDPTRRSLATLLGADSWGYQEGRIFLTLNMHDAWLGWLCLRGRLGPSVIVELEQFQIDQPLSLSSHGRSELTCVDGGLNEIAIQD